MESNLPANAGDWRDVGFISESGRSPRGGHGNPLQYPCLENPVDRGVWLAYSPQGRTELDTTERLSTKAHTQPYLWLQSLVGVGHTYSITLDIYTETLCWI